jgi:hypothetical protein
MRIAPNARCSFRSSPARQILIATVAISEIESSCRKHATKQFSNSNKNGFLGFWKHHVTSALSSLRSYPFAQLRKAIPSRLTTVLTLEVAPGGLGERIRAV